MVSFEGCASIGSGAARLVTCVVLALVIPITPLAADDVMTIGTGSTSTCITATSSSVTVPVYIRDVEGTPLDVDKPGNRIQAFSFKIFVSPVDAFQKSGGNISATVERAGITANRSPSFEAVPSGPDSISYLVSFDELTNPLNFSFNAPGDGNLVANVRFNLNPDSTATTIQLQLDPVNTALSDQSGLVSETVANGELRLRNTCIQSLTELQISIECPGPMRAGDTAAATVSLDKPAPSAVAVALSSSSSQVITVPTNVSVAAGATSATFSVTAVSSGTSRITATLPSSVGGGKAECIVNVSSCPKPPVAISPPPDAEGIPLDGTLQWTATGATSYRVFLGRAGTGCNTLFGTTSSRSIAYSGLLPATDYAWRIEAESSGCPTQSSACMSFTTESVPPVVRNFIAAPSRISAGKSTHLVWSVTGAENVTIQPGPGAVSDSGSLKVTPTETTTYTLAASGPAGSTTATTTVTVDSAPHVVVLGWPEPLLASPGERSTTSHLVLANTGGAPAVVELGQDEPFFTVSPTSLTIEPGEIAVVELTGERSDAGHSSGTINVAVDGSNAFQVPVTLFAQEAEEVSLPTATHDRIDVVRSAGSAETFSVDLTNPHASAIEVLLSAAAPWIIPEESSVSIPAGGTISVDVAIDPDLRPDTPGSLRNDLVIRTASNTMRIEITDTPRLIASSQMPTMSDDSVVVPVIGSRVDVSVSHAPTVSITHIDTAGNSQNVVIDTDDGLWLADPARTIFGEEGGILIIDAGAARVGAEGTGDAARHTVPAFRYGNAAAAGQSWWIASLASGDSRLVVQDVSGAPSTVEIELIDAAGNTAAIISRDIEPWQSIALADLGVAASAIIRNGSTSSGRIIAFAEMTTSSGDSWIVTDEARASGAARDADRLLPYAEGIEPEARRRAARRPAPSRSVVVNAATSRTTLALFNGNSTPATVAIVLQEDDLPLIERTVSIGGRQTVIIESLADQFGRAAIDGTVTIQTISGEIAAAAHLVRSTNAGVRASAVPVSFIPALQLGEARTFTGIRQVTLDEQRLVSSDLVLVNPTAADVEIVLVAWDDASPSLQGTRELTLSGGERIDLSGIVGTIMASPSIDTSENVSVMIAVTAGEGQVAAFVVTRDRATGDLTIHR